MAANDINTDGFLRSLNNYREALIKGATATVESVTNDIAEHAKDHHPFINRTYNLEKNITPLPVKRDAYIVAGGVRAGMEYAGYVEFGTSRSAPYPYLYPAIDANENNLQNKLVNAVTLARLV